MPGSDELFEINSIISSYSLEGHPAIFGVDDNIKNPYQRILNSPQNGSPVIKLESPPKVQQGAKEGDAIMVEGTIDDTSIETAMLMMNKIPIQLKVQNGRFSRKVFMPAGRVATFRIMAKNKNGLIGYSALHTVLTGFIVDILYPCAPSDICR